MISSCEISYNIATSGGGLYFGDYHTSISISNTIIFENLGVYGGGVYIGFLSKGVRITDGTIISSNYASVEGGGLTVSADDILVSDSYFIGNIAGSASGIYSESINVQLDYSVFLRNIGGKSGSFGGVMLNGAVSVVINRCIFTKSAADLGGALVFKNSVGCSLINSKFEDNTNFALGGGGVMIIASTVNITNCTFLKNLATRNGGAIYISNSENISIEKCVFDKNEVETGSGSALWLEGTSANITMNHFSGNLALKGGGTLFWRATTMDEPPWVTRDNIFVDSNRALYGSTVATEATYLHPDTSNVYNITDYTEYTLPIVVHVKDFYGEVVRSEMSSFIFASVLSSVQCFKSEGYVSGGFIEPFRNGVANFSSLLAFCDPGYSMRVDMSAQVSGNFFQTSVTLSFRECVTGEYYAESICRFCEDGTYSITDPSTTSLEELGQNQVCKECPKGTKSCYGSFIELDSGHWRISEEATTILPCPFQGSCGGGAGTGNALCTDGYEGIATYVFFARCHA